MIGKPSEKEFEAILETLPIEFSVLDKDDEYLGCLEASQNITPIQGIKGEKRLLD